MLEESDIKKLSSVFATKEDLERFATKSEYNELKEVTIRISEMVSKHDTQLDRLEENVENISKTVNEIATGVDKIMGAVTTLTDEYTAIKTIQNRHEERLVCLEQ